MRGGKKKNTARFSARLQSNPAGRQCCFSPKLFVFCFLFPGHRPLSERRGVLCRTPRLTVNVKDASEAGNWSESRAYYLPHRKKKSQSCARRKERKSVFKLTSPEEEKKKKNERKHGGAIAPPFWIAGLSGVGGEDRNGQISITLGADDGRDKADLYLEAHQRGLLKNGEQRMCGVSSEGIR